MSGRRNYLEPLLPELVANFNRVMEAYQATEANE